MITTPNQYDHLLCTLSETQDSIRALGLRIGELLEEVDSLGANVDDSILKLTILVTAFAFFGWLAYIFSD